MEIQHQDLSYEIYKRLKVMILANKFEAGIKLKQEQIAAMFGVSRMPLHKAFQMLEDELLVESRPRRGYYVRDFNVQEILDAFECREAIEGVAARRAAENASPEQVDYLYSLFSPFADNLEASDLRKYEAADLGFHKCILELSGNKVLQKLEMFGNILSKTYQRGLIRGPKETYVEHMQIIDAIAAKNGVEAERLLREHFKKSQLSIKEG